MSIQFASSIADIREECQLRLTQNKTTFLKTTTDHKAAINKGPLWRPEDLAESRRRAVRQDRIRCREPDPAPGDVLLAVIAVRVRPIHDWHDVRERFLRLAGNRVEMALVDNVGQIAKRFRPDRETEAVVGPVRAGFIGGVSSHRLRATDEQRDGGFVI